MFKKGGPYKELFFAKIKLPINLLIYRLKKPGVIMKILSFKSIFVITFLLLSPLTFSETISGQNDNCSLYFSELNVCSKMKWVNGPHLHVGNHRRGHRSHHLMSMKKYSTLDILFYEPGDKSYTPLSFPFIKVWKILNNLFYNPVINFFRYTLCKTIGIMFLFY